MKLPAKMELEKNFYDIVTVGARGQVVIPAQARKDFGVKPGDKLVVLKGMGDLGLLLVNTKHFSSFISHVYKSIGVLKEKIQRRGN